MIRNILQSIQGVEIYPIISMLVFFGLFTSVLVWFFKVDKTHLRNMAQIPLESADDTTIIPQQHFGRN